MTSKGGGYSREGDVKGVGVHVERVTSRLVDQWRVKGDV